MTVTFKTTLSKIYNDPLLLGSIIIGGLLLVGVYIALYQNLVVQARQQLVDFHYGLNMKIAASRVDSYIDQQRQQLAQLASATNTIDSFSRLDKNSLKSAESARQQLPLPMLRRFTI